MYIFADYMLDRTRHLTFPRSYVLVNGYFFTVYSVFVCHVHQNASRVPDVEP